MAMIKTTLWVNDVEYPCWYQFEHTPSVEPRIDGMPEDCYPGEPVEFNFTSVVIEVDGRQFDLAEKGYNWLLTQDVVESLIEDAKDWLEEQKMVAA